MQPSFLPPRCGRCRERGFTLVELVATLAVVAILAVLALPSFSLSLRQSRMTAASNNLVAALNTARSEAVTRSQRVSVCPSGGSGCGADWTRGWIVFVDDGTAGQVDGSDEVLRSWPALKTGDRLAVARNRVTFAPTGVPDASAEFVLRPGQCGVDLQRRVNLQALGRTSSRRESCT